MNFFVTLLATAFAAPTCSHRGQITIKSSIPIVLIKPDDDRMNQFNSGTDDFGIPFDSTSSVQQITYCVTDTDGGARFAYASSDLSQFCVLQLDANPITGEISVKNGVQIPILQSKGITCTPQKVSKKGFKDAFAITIS